MVDDLVKHYPGEFDLVTEVHFLFVVESKIALFDKLG